MASKVKIYLSSRETKHQPMKCKGAYPSVDYALSENLTYIS